MNLDQARHQCLRPKLSPAISVCGGDASRSNPSVQFRLQEIRSRGLSNCNQLRSAHREYHPKNPNTSKQYRCPEQIPFQAILKERKRRNIALG